MLRIFLRIIKSGCVEHLTGSPLRERDMAKTLWRAHIDRMLELNLSSQKDID